MNFEFGEIRDLGFSRRYMTPCNLVDMYRRFRNLLHVLFTLTFASVYLSNDGLQMGLSHVATELTSDAL